MATLHLFNPYNDLALGVPRQGAYTPPPAALAIAAAGAVLPQWWCAEGDCVVADESAASWMEVARRRYGLSGSLDGVGECDIADPWGWSVDAALRLKRAGVSEAVLPSAEWLQQHRRLSHRRTSVEVFARLKPLVDSPIPVPVETAGIADVFQALERFGGQAFVKMPYSTSGRGVLDLSQMPEARIKLQIGGMLRHQGSVIVERKIEKTQDFAMLLRLSGGKVVETGYSLFHTNGGTEYACNMLLNDNEIRERLAALASPSALESIEAALPGVIEDVIGEAHEGWLGVDMLVGSLEGETVLDPCVEVNLRRTMGVVAHGLIARFPEWTGRRMRVARGRVDGAVERLTPPSDTFNFVVE